MDMKRTIQTSCGNLEINPKGIELSEVSVMTLFRFGMALKTLFRARGPFSENFRETEKICNYIWCLLFEWAVESEQKILRFRIRTPRSVSEEEKWQYGMGYLMLAGSSDEFGIPLPMLGRRASRSLASGADVKVFRNSVRGEEPWQFDTRLDRIALIHLSKSRIAPQWAIHNPYQSFPNFTPIGYKYWLERDTSSTDRRELGRRIAAWKHGRGEFSGEDPYSRAMDIAQWREATRVHQEEEMLREGPDY